MLPRSAPAMPERDLSLETPRDENASRNYQPDAPTKMSTVKRTFSWGKRKKAEKALPKRAVALSEEARAVLLDPYQATYELGLALHDVTGDIIVSHAGQSVTEIEVGDNVLAIDGVPLDGGDVATLDYARQLLRSESADGPQVIVQRHTVRREVLERHAALRGTSLDKIGLTLAEEGPHIVVQELAGIAAKSRRVAVGDRIVAINGTRLVDLQSALDLLAAALAEGCLEVALDLVYGFVVPENHEYEAETGLFVPRQQKEGGLAMVRRSLSFGKKKKAAAAAQAPAAAPTPDLYTQPRLLNIPKNASGMIQVTFKAHVVTGELIIGLVGDGSPAAAAGVEVGDAVLAVQGNMIECEGEDALDAARDILAKTSRMSTVELLVQTKLRSVTVAFGAPSPGAPRTYLGLNFYSFPEDNMVRITGVAGPAAKADTFALGDRVAYVNGTRVWHAQSLSDHIASLAATCDTITFEVAHGYAADEGLWYGKEGEGSSDTGTPRKARRSFSFGRKPKH